MRYPKPFVFGGQLLTEIRFKQTHIISDIGSPIPAPEHPVRAAAAKPQ